MKLRHNNKSGNRWKIPGVGVKHTFSQEVVTFSHDINDLYLFGFHLHMLVLDPYETKP